MSTWLATSVPISLAMPCPLPVWAAMANQLTRQGYRLMAIAPLFGASDSLEAGRAGELTQSRLDRGQERCFGQLEFDCLSTRKKSPDKNRNLGGHCTLGLRMAELDGSTVAVSKTWSKGRQSVAFRAPGIRNAIPKSCRHLGNQRHSAIPNALLMTEHRHQQPMQDS